MSCQEVEHAACKAPLYLLFGQSQRLASRALLPSLRGCLVAADMYYLRGEDVHDFRQHVLHKLIYPFVAHAEHILIYSPVVANLIRASRTSQFRIAGQCCQHVSGHVYLRNNGDMAGLGIGHYFAGFLLSIVATVGDMVVDVGVGTDYRSATLRTYGNQLWPPLYLDAPSLVVGEVPVKHIHVMQSQQVDVLLYEFHCEEVSRTVEVHAAPCEPRGIGDNHRIHDGALADSLPQRLNAIEYSCRRTALDGDAILLDSESIALGLLHGRRYCQFDIAPPLHALGSNGHIGFATFFYILS